MGLNQMPTVQLGPCVNTPVRIRFSSCWGDGAALLAQEEEKRIYTPLDQVHCDTVALLETIAPQMLSMLLAQDVVLIL